LLPGGANQFPGGTFNPRWTSAFHGAQTPRAKSLKMRSGRLKHLEPFFGTLTRKAVVSLPSHIRENADPIKR
jgi:hypothetical protein